LAAIDKFNAHLRPQGRLARIGRETSIVGAKTERALAIMLQTLRLNESHVERHDGYFRALDRNWPMALLLRISSSTQINGATACL
jgi:hypothetical protein